MSRFLAAVALACVSTTVAGQDNRELFPNTKALGRAAAQYQDDTVQLVAAYYYSQRHHDSRWLLIEMAVTSTAPLRIVRDDITLVTPDGRIVPLATQRQFAQDRDRARLLRRGASTSRHPVASYLVGRRVSGVRWFVVTPEEGTVTEVLDVDQFRGEQVDLYFASPTGAWEEGTYSLVVENTEVLAVVPIELE